MKTGKFTLLVSVLVFLTTTVFSQARVQVIHNSADAAASVVDVWLDDDLLIDDFEFRTASPFIDAPADVSFDITIQPSNSTDTTNGLARFTYVLEDGETYILVAEGIVSPSGYDPAIPFDIAVYDMGREEANLPGDTDILVHHGSTDAPPNIDVVEISVPYNTIVDDISYGEFDGYIEIPTTNLVLNLFEPVNGTFATYDAPLSTLGLDGEAITIVASGFLYPENNSNGEAFGLWVALADGGDLLELTEIPQTPYGYFQLIHNSADAQAAVVDVWINDALAYDNLPFRFATVWNGLEAGVEFTVSIAGPNSQNPDNPIWSDTYILEEDSYHIMIAEGIVSSSGYDPLVPFDVAVYDMGRVYSNMPENTDILVHHGSTDAPTVDIYEVGVGAGLIVDNLMYGDYAGYLELETQDYVLEIRDETGTSTVATYEASLETFGLNGVALTIVASGFLDPTNNSNGPGFGLWVAPPSGGPLVELPVQNSSETARVQVIHNSADAAAQTVDVWLNDALLLDDFAFRTASPFIDAPAGVDFDITIQPSTSVDTTNGLYRVTYNLEGGSKYMLVANGIVSPSGYEPNQPFNIYVYDMAREMASNPSNTDVLVFHGSTDAPIVDVVEVGAGAGTVVDDLNYGDFQGYLELPTADYSLQVRDMSGTTTVAQFGAPLQALGLDGAALALVASGFLNPANNSNGPAFSLYVALPDGGDLVMLPSENISTARVQVIHNSADAAAQTVDVWLNDALLLDDFTFRTASPFIDAPAGVDFDITIQPSTSVDTTNGLYRVTYNLEGGSKYMLVANGIVSPSGYEPNQPFNIYVYDMAREMASNPSNTDVLVFHGSTDAPTVDVVEVGVGAGTIVDDLEYATYQGYLELPTADYSLQIRDMTGTTTVAQFGAPLAALGLNGQALAVVASGFLNPANNSNGPAFGLYAALPAGGDLVMLPAEEMPTAKVQVLHNSADAAASVVDIWLNDQLLLDDFAFRTASPFVDAPAEVEFTISIKDQNSTSPEDPIATFNYTLEADGSYILIANGIVSSSGYEPNQPFDIYVYDMAREVANNPENVDVLVFHGATDAPAVDVVEVGVGAGTIVDDLAYEDFQGYLELPAVDYSLQLRNSAGTDVITEYTAPFGTLGLGGGAYTVVASGFLNPGANSNGPAFGLFAVLPFGGPFVALPEVAISTARVQVVHNSADAAAGVVDIWLNENLILDDFAFRTASPFVDVPAGEQITVAIKDPASTSPDNPIASFNYTLDGGGKYILVANGIVSPSGYDPATPFNIYVFAGAREVAQEGSNTDVLVFHGATDAPTVDVVEVEAGAGTIVDDLSYGEFNDMYLELPTANYSLNITDASGATAVANFAAPLAELGLNGAAVAVIASGFLNPGNNSDGPAFGLLAVLADGTAVMLPNTTGVEESPVNASTIKLYPNPVSETLNIAFELEQKAGVVIRVVDFSGRTVYQADLGDVDAASYSERINVRQFTPGLYIVNILTGDSQVSRQIIVK